MKEFIIKLYSMEHFGVILFTIIGILSVLFVIVLILALRDANKTKKAALKESVDDKAFKEDIEDKPVDVIVAKEEKDDTIIEGKVTTDGFAPIDIQPPENLESGVSVVTPETTQVSPEEPEITIPNEQEQIKILDSLVQEVQDEPKVEVQEETKTEAKIDSDFASLIDLPKPTTAKVVETTKVIPNVEPPKPKAEEYHLK